MIDIDILDVVTSRNENNIVIYENIYENEMKVT